MEGDGGDHGDGGGHEEVGLFRCVRRLPRASSELQHQSVHAGPPGSGWNSEREEGIIIIILCE